MVGAGSHSIIALQWEYTAHLAALSGLHVSLSVQPLSMGCQCTMQSVGKRAAPVHLAYWVLARSHGLYCAITVKSVKVSKSLAAAAESSIGIFTLELQNF